MKEQNLLLLKNIPKYPIYYKNTIYLTPILYEQLNGFYIIDSNKTINNFIDKSLKILGGILIDTNFNHKYNNNVILNGFKDENSDFTENWFVNKIPEWMTKNIEKNYTGWFSKFNKIAIDYVFQNYNIKNVVELGSYYGLSTKYLSLKNPKFIYCFDKFENIANTKYIIDTVQPIDIKYFFKYIKFESFSAMVAEYNNVYSIKYDCFDSIDFIKNNSIKIDLFYIDFVKKDNLLISFIDKLFKYNENCIVIGDDAIMLSTSLDYIKKKYNYINLFSCYICSYKNNLINTEHLLKLFETQKLKETSDDINFIKTLKIDYKVNFVAKLINKNTDIHKILKIINELDINPNDKSYYLLQNSNLFHHIAYNMYKNYTYYLKLYDELNEKYKDNHILNNLNLEPNDYFNFGKPTFM